ncbi:unnamed protein product [Fraxinus pennsylvanica]|uniref:Uncharacterized protein n=1 Tax=Fraxinus pennsylvanica TaxID=56036 RepID=A0AAD2A8K7_9LAMI|nr:unnamed protein product [Fraxinus pennsylvanica]
MPPSKDKDMDGDFFMSPSLDGDNFALWTTKPARILLERWFAQTQKLEEQIGKDPHSPLVTKLVHNIRPNEWTKLSGNDVGEFHYKYYPVEAELVEQEIAEFSVA